MFYIFSNSFEVRSASPQSPKSNCRLLNIASLVLFVKRTFELFSSFYLYQLTVAHEELRLFNIASTLKLVKSYFSTFSNFLYQLIAYQLEFELKQNLRFLNIDPNSTFCKGTFKLFSFFSAKTPIFPCFSPLKGFSGADESNFHHFPFFIGKDTFCVLY